MKNCKMCALHKVCNDLPGYCLLLNYVAVAILLGTLGFFLYLSVQT